MNWYITAKYGKRSRHMDIQANSFAEAVVKAKLYAKFLEKGSGVYGPQCWREGQLTMVSELGAVHIIRHQIPEGWSVIEGGKKR
jgi:hypothetical protein